MLGAEVEELLSLYNLEYVASDIEADITDIRIIKQNLSGKKISWIINCAAYTAVDKAEDEPEIAFKVNVEGPLNIAKIAADKKAKLIHISTDYVFDGNKEEPYEETDEPNPVGIYGKSKYQGELIIQENLKEYFILRTSWLYGRYGNNFVYTMLRLFKEREEVSVVCDQFGSPTYAPDLARVLLRIVDLDSDDYGIYHFSNDGRISWYEFACAIYDFSKRNNELTEHVSIKKILTKDYPIKAKRPYNSCMSKEKIKRVFGLRVNSWEKSLQNFLD